MHITKSILIRISAVDILISCYHWVLSSAVFFFSEIILYLRVNSQVNVNILKIITIITCLRIKFGLVVDCYNL